MSETARKKWQKAWRVANKVAIAGRRRAYYLKTERAHKDRTYRNRYGISLTQFEEYLLTVTKCEICQVPFTEDFVPCVDHCHASSEFRGALCHHCNAAIGMLKDSVEHLESAKKYLTRLRPKLGASK